VLYVGFLEKHFKLYKAMFNKYVSLSANKTTLKKMTFDDMKQKKSKLNLADIYAFMNDFKLTKHPALKRDIVIKIIRLINLKSRGDEKFKKLQTINKDDIKEPSNRASDLTEVNLENFIEFIFQVGHLFYDRLERASVFMPLLFDYFKEVSLTSKEPLF
jgi:hypothetical protein